jgi:glycosyltransferase involved in cell wall biosynthesis
MNILAFSITPLFPEHDMGGGQKHLRTIARHLAARGHDVTILCTRRADTAEPFTWGERVRVLPILRFRQPFPAPYDTPAYHIAAIIQDVAEYLEAADRFYIHDGEFVFPYVYRSKPTVVSLRDNVYPETIQGAFHFEAHTLVVISEYARQFFLHTVGRFFPELAGRMRVIRNGIDWARFRPVEPARIRELVPVDPAQHAIVLHPHRPEESKGLPQTIEVADRLVHRYGIGSLSVCVPTWLGVQYDAGVQAFYDAMRAEIERRGLTPHFVFHPWIPVDLLPEYYALGGVTLALGSFVESFGNAVYESLGCGTPAVVARISSHRELLPESLIDKVDFDDHDTAAARAARILSEKRRTSAETLAYLHAHFDIGTQLDAYADAIERAALAPPMQYRFTPRTAATRYRLGPWCYLATAPDGASRGIYHDYRRDYSRDPALIALVRAYPAGFTLADAGDQANAAQIEAWYREGYLVPVG